MSAKNPSVEYVQRYAENGQPLDEKITKIDAIRHTLLHGSSHVWVWRRNHGRTEILLQKRSEQLSWPGYLHISAAGHIDLGETPLQAAVRETHEEIGIKSAAESLALIGVHRGFLPVVNTDLIENKFCWIYQYELKQDQQVRLLDGEVTQVVWVAMDEFVAMTKNPEKYKLVPQSDDYFAMLLRWLAK